MPARLFQLLARLRHPAEGCPWDKEQTPLSLCAGILDEAFELVEAIEGGNAQQVAEELGDLLFQLFFVIDLYAEKHKFTFDDVLNGVEAKMVRRHPHVFGAERLSTAAQVLTNWEQIKLGEGKASHPLDSVPLALPALAQARRLWHKAKRLGLNPAQAPAQEDMNRLWAKLQEQHSPQSFAQFLFALAVWGAERGLEAETCLRQANSHFRRQVKKEE